jgi:hypothetical protein
MFRGFLQNWYQRCNANRGTHLSSGDKHFYGEASLQPEVIHIFICNTTNLILPVVPYGCETWPITLTL